MLAKLVKFIKNHLWKCKGKGQKKRVTGLLISLLGESVYEEHFAATVGGGNGNAKALRAAVVLFVLAWSQGTLWSKLAAGPHLRVRSVTPKFPSFGGRNWP